jgi:DNA-binding FadR family transcriptional regulator
MGVREQLGRKLTYGLLDALGRSIVIGYYDTHVFPVEAELAKQHCVSRSVTREAVKMLCAKGLLSSRPRHGTIVEPTTSWNLFDPDVLRWLLERKFSASLLRHFHQLRLAIEPAAAALAAVHADAAQLATINEGVTQLEAADNGHDDPLDAGISFRIAVLQASNNPFFLQFRDVVSMALRSSSQFTSRTSGRFASVADHAAVRDAIGEHHAGRAWVAMQRTISDVFDWIDTE